MVTLVRPREFDEREALLAAMQVFWEKGYEATSVGDLTDRMGIQRPSLYAAFGGKKELFEAALKAYVGLSLDYIDRKLRSESSVRASLLAYYRGIVEGSGSNNPDFGCLCVNTMVELAPHEPQSARITSDYQARLTELLRERVEQGIQSGEFKPRLSAYSVARLLALTAMGLSVAMKARPDRSQMADVEREILTLLE